MPTNGPPPKNSGPRPVSPPPPPTKPTPPGIVVMREGQTRARPRIQTHPCGTEGDADGSGGGYAIILLACVALFIAGLGFALDRAVTRWQAGSGTIEQRLDAIERRLSELESRE